MIRKSTEADKAQIQKLIEMCFGVRKDDVYANLDGRYYLYFADDKLVAMSGISLVSDYNGAEVDWTCTHPEYRNKGYMQAIFTEMFKDIDFDVYCSCWRVLGRDYVNLYTLMDMFGFKEVVRDRVHWKIPHNCNNKTKAACSYSTGIGCECYGDLYLRKAPK